MKKELCSICGKECNGVKDYIGEEVDIGVGIQKEPNRCKECIDKGLDECQSLKNSLII